MFHVLNTLRENYEEITRCQLAFPEHMNHVYVTPKTSVYHLYTVCMYIYIVLQYSTYV